jgi:ABC-2 type transport system ATP-binding protein
MKEMISLKNVSKVINNKIVLDNINYQFEEGKIYGLYGINGSGKTMILRAIAGLLILSDGSITINNQVLHKDIDFPENLGLIIENMELLNQYDAYTNLYILSKIRNVASSTDINQTLDRVGLNNYNNLKVKKYSLGLKQRLNIAQAILENPKYLLLDEPFNALDDSGRNMLYTILKEEKDKRNIIIITHHYKEELYKICDTILEIKNGKICSEEKINNTPNN